MSSQENDGFVFNFKSKGGVDVIIITILMVVGIFLPQIIFEDIKAWKHDEIPGQVVTLEYDGYNTTTFMEDPHYTHKHKEDPMIGSIVFTILAGPIPFIIIVLFMLLLSVNKLSNPETGNKFELRWFVPEFLTFGYAYAISMGMCCWITYLLKYLVSWPRPDFHGRCNVNYEDLSDIHCEDEDLEGWKSFPSLQSSVIFCSMSVVVFFLWGKTSLKKPLYFELLHAEWYYDPLIDFLCATPFALASWVAATRVIDHVSFPTDILGGAFIGFVCARIGYQTQYKLNSPFSYRALTFPSIKKVIEMNEDLRSVVYPKITKYQFYDQAADTTKSSVEAVVNDSNYQIEAKQPTSTAIELQSGSS